LPPAPTGLHQSDKAPSQIILIRPQTQANAAVGYWALLNNTSGSANNAFGAQALVSNTTGNNNAAFGLFALSGNSSGGQNVAMGRSALGNEQTGFNNTAVGYSAGAGVSSNTFSGNSLLGAYSGSALTTGSRNVFLGSFTGSTTASGNNNIALGYDVALPVTNGSNQLNIGNLIFGTGINGEGTNISTGNIGIGTSTPYGRLTIWGTDAASSTLAFNVVNNASTTVFAVFDGGNAQLSRTPTQSSDARLKTNIQSLDASTSLAAINSLIPVAYDWLDPDKGGIRQYGFIAQQVEPVFPNLVSTTSATALTPDGTLGLNYIGLIAPVIKAIQALSTEIASLENSIAGFSESFTTKELTFARASGDEVDAKKLCLQKSDGSNMCVTGDQLAAALSGANTSAPANSASAPSSDTTLPIITINGNNPAHVNVGDTYADLGAIITGPQGDLNLGIKTFLNGALTSSIVIDTSSVATDTIDYVVTDQNGLSATSTRTVIVTAPAVSNNATSTSSSDATSSPSIQ
jgi:hypothetical protein